MTVPHRPGNPFAPSHPRPRHRPGNPFAEEPETPMPTALPIRAVAPPAPPHAAYDRFGEARNPAAATSAVTKLATGIGKGLLVDLPVGMAHFGSAPVRAAFAPQTVEETRNPFSRAAKLRFGGSPAEAEADVHAALGRRVTGVQSPAAIVGETARSLLTGGYDATRAIQEAEGLEAKARGVTGLAGMVGLMALGAKGQRAVRARRLAAPAPVAAARVVSPFDALANEARDLSLLKTRTPEQQARLRELGEQLQRAGAEMEPPPPVEQSGAAPPAPDAPSRVSDVRPFRPEETAPPAGIYRMPVEAVAADPVRFQFKELGTEGVSGELKGVGRFNEQLAGVISVWKDPASGQVYVVNGHHRLELARRTGQREINAQFIDAPTAEAARAEGAYMNIAEGRGTATDVAKFLRDMEATPDDLAARGVSVRGEVARDGLALSKLAPDVFDQVATAQVPQNWGVAIGALLEDPILQREALAAARGSGKRLTQAEVTEVARQVRDAGTEAMTQETLFGTEEQRRGLFIQRAQLAVAVKKRLAGDKRLFGYVAKEGRAEALGAAGETRIDVEAARGLAEGSARSEEIFNRLYTRTGPLADLVNEGARRIARGEKASAVVADIYPAIGDAVAAEVSREGGRAQPHVGEHPLAQGAGSLADEIAGATEEGRVATSQDPAQGGMFSPRRRPTPHRPGNPFAEPGQPPRATGERPPLALTSEPEGPAQQGLFAGKEGTAAARNLAQSEAAARSEIEVLRQRFVAERNPFRKSELATQIMERQKLVNRGGAIGAEELSTRATAEQAETVPTGPDQLALLSPALPASYKSRLKMGGAQVPSAAAQAEVKTLMQIGQKLAEAVRVPLRQGRFNAGLRKAAGVFKPHAEVTRVIRYDKLDTVAHEVGHFLSKKYLRNPTMRSNKFRGAGRPPVPLPKDAIRELVQMGKDLYGDRKPVGGYGEEGIAEWVSFFVTEPHTLAQKAPRFTAYMDGVLTGEPLLKAALDQARADFATYQKAPAAARVDAMISVGERQRYAPTVRDYMRAVADDIYDVRWAVEQLGKRRPASEDAATLARLTRGAFGEAQEWLERGVLKGGTADERINAGVAKTLGPLVRTGRAQEFRRYVDAESALERWSHGIDPGKPRADAQAMVDLYAKDPAIRAAAEAAWAHSLALLEARRAAGLITDAQFTQIASKNQRRVGFYRIFDEVETATSRGGARSRLGSSGLKRQTGSARRTVDPIEAIMRDTYDTAKKVRAHEAKKALIKQALETEGGGKIAEEVPAPMRPVSIPIEKLERQLAELGIVYEGIDAKTGKRFTAPIGGPGGAQINALLEAFTEARAAGGAEAKDLVFPMLMKGELRWFAVKDKALYDALVGLGPQELDIWRRVVSFPKRLLQVGATTTLEFAFGNVGRDIQTSSAFSRAGWRPPLWRHMEGLYHTLQRDPVYQRFRLHGGDQATMGGVDRGTLQVSARRLFGYFRTAKQAWLDRGQAWSRATPVEKGLFVLSDIESVILSPFEALRTVKELSETMGRVGEFAAVERKALKGGARPLDAAKEAALGARDVSLDFQQLGSATREINHLVAFFGAHIRGWAQLGRELKTRAHVVIPRLVAQITVPSLALYLLQRDDPVYRDMAAWKRDLFWVYVQRGDDQGEGWDGHGSGKVKHIWMFPKPFELGIIFGTLPERAVEWYDRQDPEQGRAIANALKRMTPPWIPTAAVPLIENYADRSTFRDRPIVPRSRAKLDPAEQSAPGTGETARIIGRALGYSPAKVENLVRGYTGGAGMYGLSATNAAIRLWRAVEGLPPLKAPREAEDDVLLEIPGLRRFLSRVPAEDAEGVERLYQNYERAERHRQTWRAMLQEGRRDEAVAYLDRHRDAILSVATSEEAGEGRRGPLREAYNQMQELQQVKRLAQQAQVPGGRARVVEAMRRLGGVVRAQQGP